MGGSFHGELLNNQMVSCFFDVESEVPFFLGSVKLSNRVPFQFMDMWQPVDGETWSDLTLIGHQSVEISTYPHRGKAI